METLPGFLTVLPSGTKIILSILVLLLIVFPVADTPPSLASTPAPVVSFPFPDTDADACPSDNGTTASNSDNGTTSSTTSDSAAGGSSASATGPSSLWLKQPNSWAQIWPMRARHYYRRIWRCIKLLAPGPPTIHTPHSRCCEGLKWVQMSSGTIGANCLCSTIVRGNLIGYPINVTKFVDLEIMCTGTSGEMTRAFINICSSMTFSGDPYSGYGMVQFSAKLSGPTPHSPRSQESTCYKNWNETFEVCSEYIKWALFPPTTACCDSYGKSYKSEVLDGPCLPEVLLATCTGLWSCSRDFWRLCSLQVKCTSSGSLLSWLVNLGYCGVTKGIPLLPPFMQRACHVLFLAAIPLAIYMTWIGVLKSSHYMKLPKVLINWNGGGKR